MTFFHLGFGYAALIAATALEGGTFLALAGFAAHRGYMELFPWVVLCGTCGSFLDALAWYLAGRMSGSRIMSRFKKLEVKVIRARILITHWGSWFLILSRFIPGVRTAGAFALGLSDYAGVRFLFFNFLAALIWSTLVACLGYVFGHGLELLADDVKQWEMPGAFALAGGSLCFWAAFKFLRRRGGQNVGRNTAGKESK